MNSLFKTFFDLSLDMFCVADGIGQFKELNHGFEQHLGYSKEELLTMNYFDLIEPEDIATTRKLISELNGGKSTVDFKNRFRRKDGQAVWLSWHAKADEKTGLLFAVARNVDKQIRSQADLNTYKKFFDMSMDMLCIAGMDGFFKHLNPAFSKKLGWSDEELKSRTFLDFIHPDDVEPTLALVGELEKGKTTIAFENRYMKKDGGLMWMHWSASPDPLSGDLYAVAHDITNLREQMAIVEKLQEEHEAELEAINNSVVRMEFSPDGNILDANPKLLEILGYDKAELAGVHHKKILFEEDTKSEDYRLFWEELRAGIPQNKEFRRKGIKGQEIWMKGSYIPVKKKEGTVYKVIKIAYDITAQKELETSLQKAKLLAEKSLMAKEDFLANMSHEIRTPLNAIIGFTNLLKESPLGKNEADYVHSTMVASKNLLSLINDILDISKIADGKLELEEKNFSVKETLEDIIRLNSQNAKSKKIRLLSSIDYEIPDLVVGDPTRLMQILINLMGNALKFTAKGRVELKAYVEEITEKEVKILFAVKDTGIGVAKEKLEKIFERFAQAEDSTTREYGGTGLGLNIVKNLVELHNSEIKIESEVGKGTEFSFEISYPIAEKVESSEKINAGNIGDRIALDNIRVLVVEDNEHNQILARTYIKRNGGFVDLAENGIVGVEKAKNNHYHCILMDLQMPKMDGFQATQKIRNEFGSNIPIIACTAHSLVGEKIKAEAMGMNAYITKPYVEKELIETILNHADLQIGAPQGQPLTDSAQEQAKPPQPEEADDFDDFGTVLDGFAAEEGPELLTAMLEIFSRRIPEDVTKLKETLEAKDLDSLNKISHKLAGSLSSINLNKGYKLAKRVEQAADDREEATAIYLAQKLIRYLNAALEAVDKR